MEKTYSGSEDGDQDVLAVLEGPMSGRHFTEGKSKQASRRWSVPWGAEVSFQTE